MSHTIQKRLASLVILGAAFSIPSYADDTANDVPWWKQQKINFMWGQWGRSRIDKSADMWRAELPRDVFRNVALSGSGGTVYAEMLGYMPVHARHAHDFGMKYFATLFIYELHKFPGERQAMTEDGMPGEWGSHGCPLEQDVYEKWMVEPYLEGIRQGLIDGMHMDWERYGGLGEADMCYCDDCFSKFPDFRKTGDKLPENIKRLAWITEHDLVAAYEANYHTRRFEMFTRIRQTLQAAKPNLIFSSYGTIFSDFTRAMNTSKVPFIFLDARHYYNDDRQAWWESYGSRLRKEGYLYIPGCYGTLFGSQANQVSAARWFYEAAINEDGYWMWFERVLDDEILRAYSTANRQIKSVLLKVGDFLFNGTRDDSFVTPVEWTGRPELEKAIIHQTYHLGNKHLVHINNGNAQWPLRVRLRFPRLPEGDSWTVRDAMGDLYYSHDDKSAKWTRDELLGGVVITLEPRSDLFLVLSAPGADAIASSRLIHSRVFNTLEDHEAASKAAGPIKTIVELYRMKNAIYKEPLVALLATTEKVLDLPKEGWRFKMDDQDLGAGEKWYLPATPMDDWVEIETEAFWGAKGGEGAGWYRRDIEIPVVKEGNRVYLHFGAVDELLVLWIDGKYAGDYNRAFEGWDQPFAIDVTGVLTAGKHHLALRVHNALAAGGVWKPVTVLVAPDDHSDSENTAAGAGEAQRAGPSSAPTGRLLYTAAEPMGFSEGSGAYTLGNAIRMVDTPWKVGPRLRQLRGHLWAPRYSPDGKRIAFVHDANGRGQIFVMNDDGSEATNLSGNSFCDRSPRWSPDGKKIAFISDRTGDWDVYAMNANGSSQHRIAGNQGLDRAPVWSPDGQTIAWESHVSGMPNIWVSNEDGQNSRPLIAPDKRLKIVQGKVGHNEVFNFAVAQWPFADNTVWLTDPVWSPKGKRIAAILLNSYFNSVVVIKTDGSQMINLIQELPGAGNLAWSPDGTQLAGTWRTAPSETERSGIFVVKTDGTDESRYGQWLVDVTPQGPRMGGGQRSGLMSWYSHGSALPSRVVKTFVSLSWSPDGQTIAFSSDMDPSGAFYVYNIPAEGGEPTRIEITRSAWPQQIMWNPR